MGAKQQTVVFDEFFEQGLPEEQSPFLKPSSRNWGVHLELRSSITAACLLAAAFILQFFPFFSPMANICLLGVYFLAGIPSLIESIEDITKLEVNIDVLMTLAAFSSVLIGNPMEGGLLLVLFAISGAMEEAVESRAKGAIGTLYKLSPTKAWVVEKDGCARERSIKDVEVGESILVRSGEIVPLDGIVVEGISSVNLVHLTGESLPVMKKTGHDVPAGAQNMEGALTLKVARSSGDSTIARIIDLVTQAQESKPKLQRWFDKMSRRYAMAVILLTALFSFTLPIIFNIPYLGMEGSIYRAVAFLIAASPCALIIATPIAYLSTVSICARKGILIKGGATLDALATCSAIAFDKTGTLTTGDLTLVESAPLHSKHIQWTNHALRIAAALEKNAVHPIARSITDYVGRHKISACSIENFKTVPGYGVEASVLLEGQKDSVFIGSPDYIYAKLAGNDRTSLAERIAGMKKAGYLIAVMLWGDKIFLFSFVDTIRPKIAETIRKLSDAKHWDLLMLTGDHKDNARKIADKLHIQRYLAELTPEDKLRYVTEISEKQGLAMVGDGINDAPALARATVGICMGKVGSGAAMEASDVVLLHDNLELLDWLMAKAEKTLAIVKQNIFLAGGVILLATTPALLGYIPLWLAVVLHEGGTVLVGLNALRLLEK